MDKFRIRLASQIIEINCIHEDTRLLCRDYIVDEDAVPGTGAVAGSTGQAARPDIKVETSEADIARERESDRAEQQAQGTSHYFSDGYLETLAVYRQIAEAMLDCDTLLFHGTALAVDGEAYVFTAPSGTGKSTHRRLWQRLFGDRLTVINDDKPLIRVSGAGDCEEYCAYVCGTPWSGVHNINTNVEVPIKAICLLERGENNRIVSISRSEALACMLSQTHRPEDACAVQKTLSVLDKIMNNVKFYRLTCNMEPEAAQIAYEGMNEGER